MPAWTLAKGTNQGCFSRQDRVILDKPRLNYLPGLDGLRAVAVVAVLLYHAGLGWLPGGFLGVEVFFVISGFIITSVLLAERADRGRIRLRTFWFRRARRLLPAVFALLVAVLAYAVLFLPDEAASLRVDALAAFGYVTNWYLVFDQQSYFESWGRPSLLRHLWSLAVEEQFYIVWPLLLVGGLALLRRRATFVAILLVAAASAGWMAYLHAAGADPSRLYYGTDTRASGLLLGAALAFVWNTRVLSTTVRWPRRLGLEALALLGLAGISAACLLIREDSAILYRGGFVLVGLATLAAIVGLTHPATFAGRLLGIAPLRWVGLRSYSIYLWHWPVFMLTRPGIDVTLDGPALLAARLALTLSLAELSYRLVETPVRAGALGRAWQASRGWRGARKWALAFPVAASSAAAAALVIALVAVQPPASASFSNVGFWDDAETEGLHASSLSLAFVNQHMPLANAFSHDPPFTFLIPLIAPAEPEPPPAEPAPVLPEEPPPPQPGPLPPPAAPVAAQVTAIGDSVMLGAAWQLSRLVPGLEMDADVGRQLMQALELVQKRKAEGSLAPTVLIHLGNNGAFSDKHFAAIMEALRDTPKVIVLNVRVPRPWEASNNEMLAKEVRRYPNAVLVDWFAVTELHPELFRDDHVHLTPDGARVYADLVASALK